MVLSCLGETSVCECRLRERNLTHSLDVVAVIAKDIERIVNTKGKSIESHCVSRAMLRMRIDETDRKMCGNKIPLGCRLINCLEKGLSPSETATDFLSVCFDDRDPGSLEYDRF